MKKILSFAVCLMVVLFSFPSISIKAAENDDIYFKTNQSVDGFFDDATYNSIQRHITGADSSTVVDYYSYIPVTEYHTSNSVESFDFSEWDFYLFYQIPSDTSSLYLYVCKYASEVHTMIACLNQNIDFNNENYSSGLSFRVFAPNVQTTRLNLQYTNGSWRLASGLIINNLDGFLAWDMPSCNLLASNGYCMARYDVVNVHGYNYYLQIGYDHYDEFTNFISNDLPFTDNNGETQDPANLPVFESNENHMYLKSCDVGFCKPYSSSDLSSAGGGYLYVNYTYDNWINSHSSDYWVNIRTVVNVDGTQYSGINTRALDLNGVNVLTFKESTVPNNWTNEGLLFVEFPNTVVSTYKSGYVYSIPYPTFANTDSGGISNRSRFLGNGRNRLFLTPSGGRGYDITDESLGDFLQSIFNVNVHQRFTLTVTVWLQDTNNNRSGEFTKSFNLITGVGTTTDTGITDNDNPFEPDPMLPDIPDGSGNDSNSVAPIVNNFMINGSGTIGYDPGYRELKEDIDKDPDGNFSQYLDPMHNDDVGSWFMSFVDEMPTEMKSILIAGVGVGVLFGLYRFIRRG